MTSSGPARRRRSGRLAAVIATAGMLGAGMLSAAIAAGPAAARAAVGLPRHLSSGGPAGGSAGPAALASGLTLPSDTPAGFWSGTDSTVLAVSGPAPYREPAIGGAYGGYVGMIGNWAAWQHCGGQVVWSGRDSAAADTDNRRYHEGIGTAVYWFMAGPGVDPHYSGRAAEARAWGAAQAARALSDLRHPRGRVTYPVVFMDVELPGRAPSFTPAPDNGWNSVYTSPCSGRVRAGYIPARVDRADVSGFAAYLTAHSAAKAGAYSSPGVWASIFGTGPAAAVPNTYEWTYSGDTSSLSHRPAGWCLRGTRTCAQFFGGMTARNPHALMWQWSGGGGTYNGYGDFDQVDKSRTPS